jgi:putative ABC transport system permease protein
MYFAHGSRMHQITGFPTIVVRGSADAGDLGAAMRRYVREMDGHVAIDSVAPLPSLVAASWAQPRFAASVVSGFAALAMALAGIGLYGALSYSVSQRRRELGVRAALGAPRAALVGLVVREGLSVTLLGVGLGAAGAALSTRLMTRLLFGTSPLDGPSFTLGPALLIGVGIVASLLPAMRAASTDPAKAIRGE